MALTEQEAKQMSEMSEAIVKIEQILENDKEFKQMVVNDLKQRVRVLEEHDGQIQKEMSTSCTLKTKEIDDKIEKSEDKTYQDMRIIKGSLIKMIIAVFGIQGAMFTLFIGAIVYMNNEHGSIYNKINDEHTAMALIRSGQHNDVVENGTNIKTIIRTLDQMSFKFDSLLKDNHKPHKDSKH